jgi:thiosulfate/3-mercaptopyruvate sulfurtransferase
MALITTLSVMTACSETDGPTVSVEPAAEPMDSLVTVEWLSQHIGDPDLVVLDSTVLVVPDGNGSFQSESGRENYEAGHIPTAAFADLMIELSDWEDPVEFTAPPPEEFVAAISALGVGDDTRVVIYDSYNSAWAARVWWMLRWVGFDNAAILDGGLAAWTAAGHPLSTEPAKRQAGSLSLALRPELMVDRDEVFASIDNDDVTLIDALPAPQYRGDMAMYARPGHIAGAINVPVTSLTDEGLYRSNEELNDLFSNDRATRTITYCGGGIAAASDAFILVRLGFKDVAVYDASLQEWAADPANPMEISE